MLNSSKLTKYFNPETINPKHLSFIFLQFYIFILTNFNLKLLERNLSINSQYFLFAFVHSKLIPTPSISLFK